MQQWAARLLQMTPSDQKCASLRSDYYPMTSIRIVRSGATKVLVPIWTQIRRRLNRGCWERLGARPELEGLAMGIRRPPHNKQELKCIRCGDRPNTVQIMLDPRTGKTLRMYECRCGERIWDD
jgi:hypothetical protein